MPAPHISTRIGIVDSGADMEHPHLVGLSCVATRNFTQSTHGTCDTLGHGTHHLGVIVNVAKAEMGCLSFVVAKVVDDHGGAPWTLVDAAIRWMLSEAVDVISIGVGAPQATEALHETIRRASRKALVVAPMGNVSVDGTGSSLYPARYREVLGVGGRESETERAGLARFCDGCDVLAPNRAYGAIPGGRFEQREGTSVASAICAGHAARLMTRFTQLVHDVHAGKGKETMMEYLNEKTAKEVIAMNSS